MLLNKSPSPAELMIARRLIRKSASHTSAHHASAVAPAQASTEAARAQPPAGSTPLRNERSSSSWKKTVWSETAFEPRG